MLIAITTWSKLGSFSRCWALDSRFRRHQQSDLVVVKPHYDRAAAAVPLKHHGEDATVEVVMRADAFLEGGSRSL